MGLYKDNGNKVGSYYLGARAGAYSVTLAGCRCKSKQPAGGRFGMLSGQGTMPCKGVSPVSPANPNP